MWDRLVQRARQELKDLWVFLEPKGPLDLLALLAILVLGGILALLVLLEFRGLQVR
jgi:hypothetical protein